MGGGARRAALAAAVLAPVLLLAFLAPRALALPAPTIEGELVEPKISSTWAFVAAYIQTNPGHVSPAPSFTWSGEYALAGPNGEPPSPPAKPGEAPWTAAGGGTYTGSLEASLGSPVLASSHLVLHHLTPERTYYARFTVADEGGSFERLFKFATKPAAAPEVAPTIAGQTTFTDVKLKPTEASFTAQIESNGAETAYSFEVAPTETGPWSAFNVGATGTISVAEDYAEPVARLTGLTPEHTYYVRLKTSNSLGSRVQSTYFGGVQRGEVKSFKTPTTLPVVEEAGARNVSANGALVSGQVIPKDQEVSWRIEYSQESSLGPWTIGPKGTISKAEAEALPEGYSVLVGGPIEGLQPTTPYYIRVFAETTVGHEEGRNGLEEPIVTEVHTIGSFVTGGAPPEVSTSATHALHGEALRLLGDVNPHSAPLSAEQEIKVEGQPTGGTFQLGFAGSMTGALPFDASAAEVSAALDGLQSMKERDGGREGPEVIGSAGGPYTVYFGRGKLAATSQPQITATAALSPGGTVSVTQTQAGGAGAEVSAHFEYVSQQDFESASEGGWKQAVSTPEVEVAAGTEPVGVGADLPALTPGETYRFRLIASTAVPGSPPVTGSEATLTVPVLGTVEPEQLCPNQALRQGPSATLPDCRAFEQLTPVDKQGAQEPLTYFTGAEQPAGALPAEDGERVMLNTPPTNWGSGPADGQSPYFFTREAAAWRLTAGAPQPQTGAESIEPRLFSRDLTRVAVQGSFTAGASATVPDRFQVGPPGGPYTLAASIPADEVSGQLEGWVGASEDFSKLILRTEDRTLTGEPTETTSGPDLYEYANGTFSQVNVGVGRCGAHLPEAGAEHELSGSHYSAGPHTVSSDGSRVFFEAASGSDCSGSEHLFVRIQGRQTLDLGVFRLLAANAAGTELLLVKPGPGGYAPAEGLYIDEPGTPPRLLAGSATPAPSDVAGPKLLSSESPEGRLTSVYTIWSSTKGPATAYRYDITAQTAEEVLRFTGPGSSEKAYSVSPDGRYFYFDATGVDGLPAGAFVRNGGVPTTGSTGRLEPAGQVFRYDAVEHMVQCLSCASPFSPEPRLPATFGKMSGSSGGQWDPVAGTPRRAIASANGDYVFFATPAALVSQDTDGEQEPEGIGVGNIGLGQNEHESEETSTSSNVYEWRRYGLHGCSRVQGCLSLITDAPGGIEDLLIGTTPSGRDVFFYTHSQLVPGDRDSAGDIYDARIEGGSAQAPPPTECVGDACLAPVSAPNDPTPASATFQGAGNVLSSSIPTVIRHVAKPKPKRRCRPSRHHRCAVGKSRRTARRAKRGAAHQKRGVAHHSVTRRQGGKR